ncbi:hypothetical protein [Paenibacillus hamazuiensis]|uniref:hypothetical protein n=1 Tax=Paenibacillus hamazuiensis TaxID=2936508 RepID=UPI00200F38F2|nr:hypothetical protein [Paenibacillus hamazuiensis]
MGKRLKKQKSKVRELSKALSVLMAASPVLLQTDAFAQATTSDPIADMYLSLNDKGIVEDLASRFQYTGNFNISSSNPNVANYQYQNGVLEIIPYNQGFATFTVTTSDNAKSDTFRVGIIDPGTDSRVDIGDLVKFASANRPFLTMNSDYEQMISQPIKPTGLVSHPPVGDGHSPLPIQDKIGELTNAQIFVTNDNYKQFKAGNLIKTLVLDDYFQDADLPITYAVQGTSSFVDYTITSDALGHKLLTYKAKAIGSSTLNLTVTDSVGVSTSMTLDVAVVDNRVNQAPTVSSVTYNVYWPGPNSAVTIPLVAGTAPLFTDPDGDLLTFELLPSTGYSNGVYASTNDYNTVNASVYFYGTPTAPVSFTVRGTDPGGLSKTITFNIPYGSAPDNPPPMVTSETYIIPVNKGATSFPQISLKDIFMDTEPLTYSVKTLPSTSTVIPSFSENGTWNTKLVFAGTAYSTFEFELEAADSVGQKVSKRFLFEVTNPAPSTTEGTYTVQGVKEGDTTFPEIKLTDFFVDTEPLTYSIQSVPSTTTVYPDVSYNHTWDAKLTFSGTAYNTFGFSVEAMDSDNQPATKSFIFNVNKRPTVTSDTYTVVVNEGATELPVISLTDFFTDTEPLKYSYSVLSSTNMLINFPGNETWDAKLAFSGTPSNSFDFEVHGVDSAGQMATKTFQLKVNKAPQAYTGGPWAASTNYGTTINETLPLRSNTGLFVDDSEDVLYFTVDQADSNGLHAEILNNGTNEAQIKITGTFTTYTEFTITATDSGGLTATKKITYSLLTT